MVKIKQVGIGRMASGTIDGITYVTRGDVTFARSTPTMPAHVYTTPAAKKRRAIFNMIQMHLKHRLPTLRKTITPMGIGSAYTRYYSLNAKPLARARVTQVTIQNFRFIGVSRESTSLKC